MEENKINQLFLSLIYNFQFQTMIMLGKLANPVTGKIEKELNGAQISIDMLDMIKEKTKDNISEDEEKILNNIIADLKLNYVEELNSQDSSSEKNLSGISEKENDSENAGQENK